MAINQPGPSTSMTGSREPLLQDSQPAVERFILPPRGKRHWWTAAVVMAFVGVYLSVQLAEREFVPSLEDTPEPDGAFQLCYLLSLLWLLLVASILAELLFRLLLLVEELLHVDSRYKGRYQVVISRTMWGCRCWIVAAIFAVFTVVVVIMCAAVSSGRSALELCWELNHNTFLLLITFQSVVHAAIGLREPSRVEVSHQMEKASNDVAHGLAWSQYYGFIEKITSTVKTQDGQSTTLLDYAPTYVESNPEIQEKITAAGAKNVNILVILIPESCDIPDEISGIEFIGKVPYDLQSGGNVGRGYGQSFYLIKSPPGEPQGPNFCCMAVYADNLKTLKKMSETGEGGLSADERYEQMRLYVASLQDIIRKNGKDFVLLLPFDDKEISEDGLAVLMWRELKRKYDADQLKHGVQS